MAFTALCKALYLLLCRKLEMPLYCKPMKPEISYVVIPLFSFLSVYVGKIKPISLFEMLCVVCLKELVWSL